MKPNILTITALVFAIGVLISSLGITEGLDKKREAPPPALHQAISVD